MGNLGLNSLAVACVILLFANNFCSPSLALSQEKKCAENKYLNVFTQKCTDFKNSNKEVQGDCPYNNMHLKLIDGTKTVTCACNVRKTDVPLIYVPQKKQCYKTFDQGPCRDCYILMIKDLKPTCVPDPCSHLDYSEDSRHIVPIGEDCFRLGESCEGGKGTIDFIHGNAECFKSNSKHHTLLPTGTGERCPPNTYNFYGQCIAEGPVDYF